MRAKPCVSLAFFSLLAACAGAPRPVAECPPCAQPPQPTCPTPSAGGTAPAVTVAPPGPPTFLARVMPDDAHSANIASPVEGTATELRVNVGDHIRANDVVAVVTRTDGGRPVQVRSPVDGVVVERAASLGAAVAPHGPPMFFVAALEFISVVAEVPQHDLPTIQLGAPVTVRVAMFPDRIFAGQVTRIHPAVDPSTGMGTFIVALPNPDGALRPGSDARVQLPPPAAAQ